MRQVSGWVLWLVVAAVASAGESGAAASQGVAQNTGDEVPGQGGGQGFG
jgi:hypothetical protein